MVSDRKQNIPCVGLFAFAAVLFIALVFKQAEVIVAPLLLAVVVVITLAPVADKLTHWGLPRGLAVTLISLLLILTIVGIGLMVAQTLEVILDRMDSFEAKFEESLEALSNEYGFDLPAGGFDDLIGGDEVGAIIEAIIGMLALLVGDLFLFVFAFVFALIGYPGLKGYAQEVEQDTGRTFEPIKRLSNDIYNYMTLKTLTNLVTAILMAIWLAVLGVPYIFLWCVLTFLLSYIPNIGIAIPATGAALIALAENGLIDGLAAGLGFAVVSTFINHIVEPRVFGKSLNLSMFVVFVSLFIWGWVLGPVGVLLAVPLTMMLKRLLEPSPETRWMALFLTDKNIAEEKKVE